MVKAIRIHKPGGIDAMVYEDVEVGEPGKGEVRLKQKAIGVNYIDVYQRSGAYPLASYPAVIGMEGAGVIEAVGKGVKGLVKGDRVAYAAAPPGAYAEKRLMPADRLVKLPDAIKDKTAACIMLQGMTAQYLLKQTYRVKRGDWVLVHAAAGGMGLILCQWAKALGAKVIGTTSTKDKAKLAKKNGCDFPIIYTEEDFAARVKEITGGKGVAVVYDGVGKDTFLKSLDCLAMLGHLVLYGGASGQPDPIAPAILGAKSASLTRPTLFHYTADPKALQAMAADVFKIVRSGKVKIQKPAEYKLGEAGRAHADLTGRKTTGPLILIP
jgi:NADPH:quinone reductase